MKGLNQKFSAYHVPLLSAVLLLSLTAGCSTRAGTGRFATGGYVVVQFCIEKTGAVSDARVMESSPPGKFDADALRVARQWHFRPVMFVGVPTRYCGAREKITFNASGQVEKRANLGTDLETGTIYHHGQY